MFNLKEEIIKWKKTLKSNPAFDEGIIAELESHLIDSFEELKSAGKSETEAFQLAVEKLGIDNDTGESYHYSKLTLKGRIKYIIQSALNLGLIFTYIKIATRLLFRDKIYSSINIIGLSLGLTAAIILGLWAEDEFSYDKFFKDSENIYRVLSEFNDENGNTIKFDGTPALLSEAAQSTIPQVIYSSNFTNSDIQICKTENISFYEDKMASCDPAFLDIFELEFISGNKETAFTDKNTIAISERLAEKYFGKSDAIGEIINWNNWTDYKIGAVFKTLPHNTHFKFEFLNTFENERGAWKNGFTWYNFIKQTYVKLQPGSDLQKVESMMTDLLYRNNEYAAKNKYKLFLQPLEDIHLESGIQGDDAVTTDKFQVYVFLGSAILILMIACFNFMNLSFARATKRLKEIGLRKTVGANKIQAVTQQFVEMFFQIGIAVLIALPICYFFLPLLNAEIGKNINMSFSELKNLWIFAAILIITIIASGFYPAFVLSSLKPVSILKKETLFNFSNSRFRKILVIVQYSISLILIIVTFSVQGQFDYMQNLDMGFEKSNIVRIPFKDGLANNFDTFKNNLLNSDNIESVALKDCLPTTSVNYMTVRTPDEDIKIDEGLAITAIGYDYFDVMKMEFISGEPFSQDKKSISENSVILNETAVKKIGLDSPIGKTIIVGKSQTRYKVLGVVKDAKVRSLYREVEPTVYTYQNNRKTSFMNLSGVVLIRFTGPENQAVKIINSEWEKINPNFPLVANFLEDDYKAIYKSEEDALKIFSIFAFLAVFISTLGVFGLTVMNFQSKMKEIGIRKTLGASVISISKIHSHEIIKMLSLSCIIAIPLSIYFVNEWLQKFYYNSGFQSLTILGAILIILFSVLITNLYFITRCSIINPATILRNE